MRFSGSILLAAWLVLLAPRWAAFAQDDAPAPAPHIDDAPPLPPPAPLAEPAGPSADGLDFLTGNWQISYEDRLLGLITGWAVARRDEVTGEMLLQYTVRDPRSSQTHVLHALRTEKTEQQITFHFHGSSPSAAVTTDGQAEHAPAPDVPRIEVPAGAIITAELDGEKAEAAANPAPQMSSGLKITFKLGEDAKVMTGSWRSARHPHHGYRGLRSGERSSEKRSVEGVEDIQYESQFMTGPETWKQVGPQITRVTIAQMHPFGRFAAAPSIYKDREMLCEAWLRIEGEDLPVEANQQCDLVFKDAKVRSLKAHRKDPQIAGALQVLVELDKSIQPGKKPFTLNGSPGTWSFDFPGLDQPVIRYIREVREGEFQQAAVLYVGEVFHLEVEYPHAPFYSSRVFSVKSTAYPIPTTVPVTKLQKRPAVFRSGPLLLAAPGEKIDHPLAAGGAADKSRPVVSAAPQSQLLANAADAQRPDAHKAVGRIDVLASLPGGRFAEALQRAEDYRKANTDPDRYTVSVRIITAGLAKRGTHISKQDHAALIILAEELRDNLGGYLEEATRPFNPSDLEPPAKAEYFRKRQAWVQEVVKAARSRSESPLMLHDVSTPDGASTSGLMDALSIETQERHYKDKPADFLIYADRAITEAQGKMVAAASGSMARLRSIDMSDPRVLLALARTSYGELAPRVANDLMRPARPGEPAIPRMVPDLIGKTAILGIADLIEAVKADEGYAAFDKLFVMLVTAPVSFLSAPAAGAGAAARGTWLAVRGVQIASEIGNTAIFAHDLKTWDTATGEREFARGSAPITGVDAYNAHAAEARDALFSAAMGGGLTVGLPLFAKAASMGLRPSRAAMEAAADQASRRGVKSLSPEGRNSFEFLRGRAEYRAARYGPQTLTELERRALAAAYPDGIPAEVATRLKIKPDDKSFRVAPDRPNVAKASEPPYSPIELSPELERRAFSDSDDLAIDVSDMTPELSSNTVIRNAYRQADDAVRGGAPEALAKRKAMAEMADQWSRLPPAHRARVDGAWDILQRLKREYPQLAKVDDAQAMQMLMLHSRRTAAGVPVPPEELASLITGWNRVPVTPESLARAANTSDLNAAAALRAGDRFSGLSDAARYGRTPPPSPDVAVPNTPPAPVQPPGPPRAAGPGRNPALDETIDFPPPNAGQAGAGDVTGTVFDPAVRQRQIARRLGEMGVPADKAVLSAVVPGAKRLDMDSAVVGAAWNANAKAKDVMRSMNLNEAQLRDVFDRYHANSGAFRDPASRQHAFKDWLDGVAGDTVLNTARIPRPVTPAPRPAPGAPAGLDPPSQPIAAARSQVRDHLEKMGVDRDALTRLDLDESITLVDDPRVAAAGLGRKLDVDAPAMRRALDSDPKEVADMLDRFDEAARPGVGSRRRAEEVTDYLRDAGDANPLGSVLEARQARADRAMRDLGVEAANRDLVNSGLGVDAVVAGSAMESGIRAETLLLRRGVQREHLAQSIDNYLREGRGITDAAQRAKLRDEYLAGRYVPSDASYRPPVQPNPVASADDVEAAMARMNVPPAAARASARNLAPAAGEDAYRAIVGGAIENGVPPAALRQTFGLTDAQIAAKLDDHLRKTVGVTDESQRVEMIATELARPGAAAPTPAQIRAMIESASPPTQPLRPRSTAARTTAADPPIRPVALPPSVLTPPPTPPVPLPRPLPPPPPPLPRLDPAPVADPNLDRLYGRAVDPAYIKPFERTSDGSIRRNPLLQTVDDRPWISRPTEPHIWSIDERGRLLVGVETVEAVLEDFGALRLGHPSLTGGGRARISGELRFDPTRGQWVINNQSGRYSVRAGEGALTLVHLQNVASLFQTKGLPVLIDN